MLGGGEIFLSDGKGHVRWCVFGTLGRLMADDWVFVSILPIVFVNCPALGVAGIWVVPALGFGCRSSWEFSLVNTSWGLEFSCSLASIPRGSVPTSGQGTKTPQAICHGNKGD